MCLLVGPPTGNKPEDDPDSETSDTSVVSSETKELTRSFSNTSDNSDISLYPAENSGEAQRAAEKLVSGNNLLAEYLM